MCTKELGGLRANFNTASLPACHDMNQHTKWSYIRNSPGVQSLHVRCQKLLSQIPAAQHLEAIVVQNLGFFHIRYGRKGA